MQFTDLHLGAANEKEAADDARTVGLMEQVIAAERPDLIVLTGDLIWGGSSADPRSSFRQAIAPAVDSKLPWAAVFGNHDSEGSVKREDLALILEGNSGCLAQTGPAGIHGIGNYFLTVASASGDGESAALYFWDSGNTAPEQVGGYDWIHPDQIQWYMRQSRLLNERCGKKLPSLGFFHIPIPEYEEVWRRGTVSGTKGEKVCAPVVNSGLFAAMLEMGDIIGTFVGHDHDNDYCGMLNGIRLCYGRVTGYNCYGKLPRGGRVIRLHEGKREFETWLRLEGQRPF